MSSSGGSDDGTRTYAYTPVLAERMRGAADSPAKHEMVKQWPVTGVQVYDNQLFTDADGSGALGTDQLPGSPTIRAGRPASAQRMQQAKSSLAARRAERMQANILQSNSTGIGSPVKSPMPPGMPPPALQRPDTLRPRGSADEPTSRSTASSASNVYGLRATYDPNEEQQISAVPRAPQQHSGLDLSNMPAFLMQPGTRDGQPIMCRIIREKLGTGKLSSAKYSLILEANSQCVLAARKRKKQRTSNYLVSLDTNDLTRDSDKFFGKLRANFVGTEFTVFDGGAKAGKQMKEKKTYGGHAAGSRQELGCVTYQLNLMGTRGPRKMTAAIPAVDDSTGQRMFRPTSEADNLLERVKSNKGLDDIVVMRNKPPRWNDELNAYCLNFNGRVTEASVKNFQLVADDNVNHVILQFGKIGKEEFTMDYQWPINALQAFCICLSSFDNKLGCE